jgi:hypothetical protein
MGSACGALAQIQTESDMRQLFHAEYPDLANCLQPVLTTQTVERPGIAVFQPESELVNPIHLVYFP